MAKFIRTTWTRTCFVTVLALIMAFGSAVAHADEPGDFYKGKILQIMTPNGPGGGFDFYMRTVAKHMERVSGMRIVALNVEGAGGTLGDNRLYLSKPDGLTIGLINYPGHVFAQLQGHPGVRYDFREWEWIGRAAGIPPAIAVAVNSPYNSVADLINADRPVRFALEGRGSDAYYGTVFLENLLKMPVNKIIGYGGPGEIAAAMLSGEIEARFESVDTLMPLVEQGEMRLLLIIDSEHDRRVPDVPIPSDLDLPGDVRAKLEAFGNIYELERSFVAPPGTPSERVAYLRDVFWEAVSSKAFQDEMKAAGRGLQLMKGEEVAGESRKVAAQADELTPLFEE